jgi:hypothetical protein
MVTVRVKVRVRIRVAIRLITSKDQVKYRVGVMERSDSVSFIKISYHKGCHYIGWALDNSG